MNTKLIQSALRLILALVISLSLAGISTQEARAAVTYTVTNLLDDGSNGSLRKAITDANANGGADIINFSVSGTIPLTSTLPQITEALTIDGSGQNVTISGNNLVKVMIIATGISVTLNQLSIINGKVGAFTPGGGISNYGVLTVTNCIFSGNQATFGGAIHNDSSATLNVSDSGFQNNSVTEYGAAIASVDGTVTVTNSTFSNNHSSVDGGAVYGNQNTGTNTMTVSNSTFAANTADGAGGGIENYLGTLTVTNSTFVDNDAIYGGGVHSSAGTLTVANSTFSGNTADYGGGVYASAAATTVKNSTFSANHAANSGGGFYNWEGSLILKNTILANATSGGDCYSKLTPDEDIKNLIESNAGCGTPVSSADPMLGPLASNGGPLQTFALLPGSPAIDAGDDATCAAAPVSNLDQRGVTRPYGAHCDIGSYELKKGSLTAQSVGTYDGHILELGENTTTGGTLDSTSPTFYLGDDASDKQYRTILSFDTSALPSNAVITRVILKLRKQGLTGTDPFTILGGLKVDIRKNFFGTGLGLVTSDFQATASRNGVGTFKSTPKNNWYFAVIGSVGYPSISLNGTTQLRLLFSTGDNDNGVADYMKFFSGNYTNTAARPTLVVEYYEP